MIPEDGGSPRFDDLRLSITGSCNFRCAYCLSGGFRPTPAADAPLTPDEIRRLVAAFAALGVEKVRLTGGEPTLRRDLASIIRTVAGARHPPGRAHDERVRSRGPRGAAAMPGSPS